ncbi:sigma-54-dependent transcriptional regulator [Desulfovibrio ferrophilus]|uniref:Two-component, sigma54 specific, transcriptional regulator, Fis family n=1 Tax=Desulfovibrio ferrophilus TaxID=241368 RepID=A0A2Z6B3G6_9BACT|nr:sigma-54 dependent transcriptional regulator [Desulfovibrio ferrophilus]BBD10031.1 two-component, sigma54 specific, transcriptional regulator, Fis family [Desulfovibrio ferrophilus]
MANVLVIDDDQMICEMIADIVQDVGHHCDLARSIRDGLVMAQSGKYDVIFQDVYLADGMGLDILPQLKDAPGAPEVVIITGAGEAHVAERAMREGAWDFVAKPLDLEGVIGPLERALKFRDERRRPAVKKTVRREGIAGSSPLIRALLDTVAMAGESGASVLITGETGTGKELFARAIHANSPRSSMPFVVVDCASLPETLVESILFGHVKGAFTGADKARDGLVKLADGGTLFLDEVGELPFAMQRAFLRVLEERMFRPVGSKTELSSDFRLVAATNRHLDEMVELGDFRKDLLYRIRSFSIELPPLRERVEDIEEIITRHMSRMATQGRFPLKGFSPEFVHALSSYPWPGNVRELVQCLERSLAAAHADKTLFLTHLPENVRVSYARTLVNREGISKPHPGTAPVMRPASPMAASEAGQQPLSPAQSGAIEPWSSFRERIVGQAESEYFERLMAFTHGNVRESCEIADVSRARLYQILQKRGIKRSH